VQEPGDPPVPASADHRPLQAAERLSQAAGVISRERGALTLRTLQTLAEVASEHNSTLVLPIPIEILDSLPAGALYGAGDR
jgi:hypothetical protein